MFIGDSLAQLEVQIIYKIRFNYDFDTTICQNDSIIINSLQLLVPLYNWSPNYNISNNTLAAPLFYPDTTTIYLDVTNIRLYIY